MTKLLKIEIAVLIVLLLVAIGIRSNDAYVPQTDILQQPQTSAPVETLTPTVPLQTHPTQPAPTDPPETTVPPTVPQVVLTIGEDVTLEAKTFFVYNTTADNWMAISGDPDKKLYPASITKLFTSYIAMSILDPDTVVTLGSEVNLVASDSSLAYLKPGMKLTVEQLLACMLLPSGNDAAYAMAVAAAREYYDDDSLSAKAALKAFVELMNQRAQEEGMVNTQFVNPDGYHDWDHYTTCQDMVTMARLALSNEVIRRTVSTSAVTLTYVSGETKFLHNTNLLLDPNSEFYCEDAIGLKTGNTSAAGPCLLSAFEVEGNTIIIGTLACGWLDARFEDTLKLYDLVLEAYAE